MKISLKIFIFTYCIIVVITVLGGFFLINYEYEKSLEQAKSQAMVQNETLFTYVATLEELLDKERAEQSLNNLIERMSGENDEGVFVLWNIKEDHPNGIIKRQKEYYGLYYCWRLCAQLNCFCF